MAECQQMNFLPQRPSWLCPLAVRSPGLKLSAPAALSLAPVFGQSAVTGPLPPRSRWPRRVLEVSEKSHAVMPERHGWLRSGFSPLLFFAVSFLLSLSLSFRLIQCLLSPPLCLSLSLSFFSPSLSLSLYHSLSHYSP